MHQINGMVMGVNLAPSIANAFALEAKLMLADLHLLQHTDTASSRSLLHTKCLKFGITKPIPFTHPAELRYTLRQIDDVAF